MHDDPTKAQRAGFTAVAAGWAGRLLARRRWLLLGLVGALHLAILQSPDTAAGRLFLLVHLGIFLLWQPIVRAETRLRAVEIGSILAVATVVALAAQLPLLVIWVMVLGGIVGGKVFFSEDWPERLLHLSVLGYLVSVLIVLLLPGVLPRAADLPELLLDLVRYALPVMLLGVALIPARAEGAGRAEVIDLVYSAFVFLLLAVLVLGALAVMLLTERGYVESLLLSLASVSAVLFVLGWAWNPRIGFSGLGLVFSRYMLSVGMPFEEWLLRLSALARSEADVTRFMELACRQFLVLPGVVGGSWRAEGEQGEFGEPGGARRSFSHPVLTVELLTRRPIGPALTWHFNLLVQMLGEIYLGKVRARELERGSYVRAVHETGARLTHDVKNLLQSLNTLCFAAGGEDEAVSPEFQALVRRQLPAIARRLEQTLTKLRRPEEASAARMPAEGWWRALRERYSSADIRFVAEGPWGEELPAELFDRISENLIQNALDKRRADGGLTITVTLDAAQGSSRLSVCDDGAAIAAGTAGRLLVEPVLSGAGLGIGLYQAARQAALHGYRLALTSNEAGRVCFTLAPGAEAQSPAPAA